ncbi:GNAT family N-acetyltransferase [Streptomyces sp. MK37H]|uniref:GNAT family N-acetyltransferase n=1 Tax=Streptomyces sp. MK37H TaxID=2699117 RepID=UPI001B38E668|nr:GNAT family protein [Streptomyces sp. MK37H]MBP8533697.1 GNAT family N-acetyltransferase [Streptomyces sp. MK37H]
MSTRVDNDFDSSSIRDREGRNLRPFSRPDVSKALKALQEATDLWEYGSPYWQVPSEADLLELCEQKFKPGSSSRIDLGIFLPHNDPVGQCSIHAIDWRNRTGQLGVAVWKNSDRGKGLGSNAIRHLMQFSFDDLDMFRLEAFILQDNKKSLHLFKGLGFQQEGILRERYLRRGKRVDVVVLASIRDK